MKISIIGAGSWGTALGQAISRSTGFQRDHHDITLWGFEAEVESIQKQRENQPFLSGIPLHPSLRAHEDLGAVLEKTHLIIIAIPAQAVRDMMRRLSCLGPSAPLLFASKGIEQKTSAWMHDVLLCEWPEYAHNYGVIAGPNLAREVAEGRPTRMTIASESKELISLGHQVFSGPTLLLDHTSDVLGVEIAGALKNVYAVLCGWIRGRDIGANALSSVMASSFQELCHFGQKMGASFETFLSCSAGLADFILTCSSPNSRNVRFGEALAKKTPLPAQLAEGVFTVSALTAKAKAQGIAMPLAALTEDVIHQKISDEEALETLWAILSNPSLIAVKL